MIVSSSATARWGHVAVRLGMRLERVIFRKLECFGYVVNVDGCIKTEKMERSLVAELPSFTKDEVPCGYMVIAKDAVYNMAMTAIVAIRHTDGVTIKSDSLGLKLDENNSSLIADATEHSKIFEVSGRAIIGLASDSLGENIEHIIVAGFKSCFDENPLASVKDILSKMSQTSFKLIRSGVTQIYGNHIQILVAGYDVDKTGKPTETKLFTVDIGETIEINSMSNYAAAGSSAVTDLCLKSVEKTQRINIERTLYSREVAEAITSVLLLACSNYEVKRQKDGKPSQIHVGGKVIHYELTRTGVKEVESNEGLPILAHKGQLLF